MNRAAALVLLLALPTLVTIALSRSRMNQQNDKSPTQVAEGYVRSFQEGRGFIPPCSGLLHNGEPYPEV